MPRAGPRPRPSRCGTLAPTACTRRCASTQPWRRSLRPVKPSSLGRPFPSFRSTCSGLPQRQSCPNSGHWSHSARCAVKLNCATPTNSRQRVVQFSLVMHTQRCLERSKRGAGPPCSMTPPRFRVFAPCRRPWSSGRAWGSRLRARASSAPLGAACASPRRTLPRRRRQGLSASLTSLGVEVGAEVGAATRAKEGRTRCGNSSARRTSGSSGPSS